MLVKLTLAGSSIGVYFVFCLPKLMFARFIVDDDFQRVYLKSASFPYHVRVENGLKIYPWLVDKPGGNVDAENSNRSITYNRVLRIFEVRTNIIKVG